MTLTREGERVRVTNAGGSVAARKRLGDLGLFPGAFVTVISSAGGNLIVALKDSRIAIDKRLARLVLVEPVA